MTRLLCHLAVTVALHSTAFSQQPSATLSLDEELTEAPAFDPRAVVDEWQITIEPSIAFMAFAGDLTMPGAGSVEIELDDLNLDSPTLAPFGAFRVARGKWSVSARAVHLSAEGDATATSAGSLGAAAFARGDRLSSEVSFSGADLRAGYNLVTYLTGFDDLGREELRVALDAEIGARLHEIDFDTRVSPIGGAMPGAVVTSSVDETFVEPIIGVSFDFLYRETAGFNLYLNSGGLPTEDRSSFSLEVGVDFKYRFTSWLGARVGYRLLYLDLEAERAGGDFDYRGTLAGLYWGVSLHF